VTCTARNSADLNGLLTIFHTERSADALQNVQNDLPILTDYDKKALEALLSCFEVDFVSLSFVREADDVHSAREFLDSLGHTTTKVRALPVCPAGTCNVTGSRAPRLPLPAPFVSKHALNCMACLHAKNVNVILRVLIIWEGSHAVSGK
jgi:hypothetical protein